MSMMTAIRAAHYGETEARLTEDPIIVMMAEDLKPVPVEDLAWPDGTPRFEFMQKANRAYRQFGGTDGGHIGAIATALLILKGDQK